MTATIDKNMLKQALRELINEEPNLFKQLLAGSGRSIRYEPKIK
jgi:hypothetical protein